MSTGLLVFVVVVAVDVLGLLLDLALATLGETTISEHARTCPLLGAAIVVLQTVGTTGLVAHFWE